MGEKPVNFSGKALGKRETSLTHSLSIQSSPIYFEKWSLCWSFLLYIYTALYGEEIFYVSLVQEAFWV